MRLGSPPERPPELLPGLPASRWLEKLENRIAWFGFIAVIGSLAVAAIDEAPTRSVAAVGLGAVVMSLGAAAVTGAVRLVLAVRREARAGYATVRMRSASLWLLDAATGRVVRPPRD